MGDDIKNLLSTIVAQNNEIKKDISEIKAELQAQKESFEKVNENIAIIEKENQQLKGKLASVERKLKRNNIIIFGIKEDTPNFQNNVTEIINKTLHVTLNHDDINNIYRVGNKLDSKTRPIVLELVTLLKKQEILRNSAKLKGSGIVFANDLIPEDREKQKFLYNQLKIARETTNDAKIIKNTLVVCGITYTWDQLESQGIHNLLRGSISDCTEEESTSTLKEKQAAPSSSNVFSLSSITEVKRINTPEGSKHRERGLRSNSKKSKP